MADIEVTVGAELPNWTFTWKDSAQAVIDLTAYTPVFLKLGNPGQAALYTQTDDITFAATAPNVTAAFDVDDLASLPTGTYAGQIRAKRTSDNKDRDLWFTVFVKAAIT